jgi:hypothetical protein
MWVQILLPLPKFKGVRWVRQLVKPKCNRLDAVSITATSTKIGSNMLRVTLEMVPFGQEDRKRTIGVLEVSNIGVNEDLGDYLIELEEPDKSGVEVEYIKKYPRSKGAWTLVRRALQRLKR